MPPLVKKCIESWSKFCPDYEIKRWDETNLDINKYEFAKAAYENKKWAFFSDVHRFDILYQYGGIYLDVDVELISSLDNFLNLDFFTGFEYGDFIAPGLILGANKKNKICSDIINIYKNKNFNEKKLDTVCVLCTDYLKEKYDLICNGETQSLINNIKIFSKEYFCPKNVHTGEICITSNTVCIHHYLASWVPKPTLLRKFIRFIKKKLKLMKKKLRG